jgi:hypothetical protein
VVVCGSAGAEKRIGGVTAPPNYPDCIQAVSLVQLAAATRAVAEVVLGGHSETGAVTEGPGLEVEHATIT